MALNKAATVRLSLPGKVNISQNKLGVDGQNVLAMQLDRAFSQAKNILTVTTTLLPRRVMAQRPEPAEAPIIPPRGKRRIIFFIVLVICVMFLI